MFERFTQDARQTVILAQQEARRLLHHHIGAEHLLLGLLGAGDGPGAQAMAGRGLTAQALRTALSTLAGPDIEELDADALASIGIDLEAVRQAAEAEFGAGALDGSQRYGRGRKVHIPFTPEAKKALQLALRHALRLESRRIDSGHILLGVLHTRSALVGVLLRDAGVDAQALRDDITRVIGSRAA